MSPHVLVVQHQENAGPGQLLDALALHGLGVEIWSAGSADPLPERPERWAAIVVLGGDMDAIDEVGFPHLRATRDLIARSAESDVPVLGLCLGGQLAALALGGKVSRRSGGPCIGFEPATPAATDAVTRVLNEDACLFHWHRDVFTPPPGATAILEDCGAFRLGCVRGLQAHPEVTTAILEGWTSDPAAEDELASSRVDPAALNRAAPRHLRHGRGLLEAWAAEISARRGPLS